MTTISSIYTSRNILLEVLKLRGFDISEYNNYTISHVGSMHEHGQLDLLLENGRQKVFVKYCLDSKPNLSNLIDEFFKGEDPILEAKDDLIVLIKDEVNESAMEFLDYVWSSEHFYITLFNIKRLQYNILDHELVPKHTVLSEEDKQAVLAEYNVTVRQLPEIGRYDPVASLLGMRPGMVCKIARKSKTSIHADYYRACV
jgi:DNA-directed RNA polymerase subunit H (RpoH/RPB5)